MGYIPINPSSPLALKALFLLALPREANETSIFKLVREGLGKNRPIDLQSVSQWPPKPFLDLSVPDNRNSECGKGDSL
jgi:hypothetical protein